MTALSTNCTIWTEGGLLAAEDLGARLVVQRLLELVAHHSTRRAARVRGAPLLTDPLLFGAFWVGGEQFKSSAMKFSETFADAEASEASEAAEVVCT